jgi:AcrR family transcriptional regulator
VAGTSARAAQAAQTRARILASARRVLAEEGIEGFTTRRVAELAGISHGMVHYHFETKRDLILALAVHARRDWIEPLEELVDGPGTAEARMEAVIAWVAEPATRDVIRVHAGLFAYALQDDAVRERLAAEYARWRAPFVTLFGQLVEEVGAEGLDPGPVGDAFAITADALVELRSLDPSLPTEALLTQLLDRLVWPAGRPPRRRRSAGGSGRRRQGARRKRR